MKLDTDVKAMLASDVPKARCIIDSGGRPSRVKQKISIGTMIRPPPTPSSPASTPAIAPTLKYKNTAERS